MGKRAQRKMPKMPLSFFQGKKFLDPNDADQSANESATPTQPATTVEQQTAAVNVLTTPRQEIDRAVTQQVAHDFVQQAIARVLEKKPKQEKSEPAKVVAKKPEPKKPLTMQQETANRVNRFNSIWKEKSSEDRTNADVRPGISFGSK